MNSVASVGLFAMAIIIAAIGVFALTSIGSMVQTQPNPVQVTNYSAAVNSPKPQINSIAQTSPEQPVMTLDKSSYFQGDLIYITANGLDSQSAVNVQLVGTSGFVLMQRNTMSDLSGKMSYDFPLPATVSSGKYE